MQNPTILAAAALLAFAPLTLQAQSANRNIIPSPAAGGSSSYSGATLVPTQIGIVGNSLAQVGGRLTTDTGRALYTFASDPVGGSVCTTSNNCAQQWPPYLIGPVPANIPGFTAIVRPDGTRQWAANGKPLYLFVGDPTPGQFTGDQVPGWASVRLAGS